MTEQEYNMWWWFCDSLKNEEREAVQKSELEVIQELEGSDTDNL